MIRKIVFAFVMVMLLAGSSWPYTGTGTSSDPFVINSYSDFRTLMQSDYATSGSYFKLSCDIQMSGYSNWEPKGTTSAPFTGHFDGQGHIIYINIQPLPVVMGEYINLTYDRSLFGVLGTGGEILNLDVEGTVRGYNAGGMVSVMQGGTIKNCAFSGDVIVETSPAGDDAMSELIYELGDDDIQDANGVEILDDVTAKTRVYGKINAGGLAAVMLGGTIEASTFRGNVIASADATPACAGGIAGRMIEDSESISGCYVEGDALITASTSANGYGVLAAAGGIVGYANTQLDSSIEGCTFDGVVNSTYYAGGIAGDVYGTILSGDTVSRTAKITGTYSAGGIAGYMAAGAWAKNNTVESGAAVAAEVYSSGGIIGLLETSGRTGSNKPVEGNTSAAALSGEVYKGGIVGALGNNTYSGAVIGEGNTYSGTDYGIGRDEWGQPSDGHESFSITTSVLTNAIAGRYYTASLSLDRTPSADLSVVWTFRGTLPEGLTASDSGIISGTPAKPETRTFTAGAFITGYGPTQSADITITVLSSDASAPTTTTGSIDITTNSLPDGREGTAYSYTLAAALAVSSDSSVVWRVSDGNLPAGLSLDRQGVISGTPYSAGTYTFTVQAESGQLKGSKIFTLTINSAFWIMTDSALPNAKAGESYSVTLSSDTDAANLVSWEILNGSLPSGMSLNPETGNISGTPSRAGSYTFTVRAVSGYSVAQKQFTLKVELVITSDPYLANGTAGEMYTHVFTAEGASPGAIYWTVSSDKILPTGLTLAANGILSGKTNYAGTYTFMVYALADNDASAQQIVSLTIDPQLSSAVPVLTVSLPDGQVSEDYYTELRAGIEGVTWRVESGDIPEGLTLRTDGVISGVPVKTGVYSFVVRVSDSNRYSTRQFTITVKAPEPEPERVSSGGGGCDSGIGAIGLAVLAFGLMFRRYRR